MNPTREYALHRANILASSDPKTAYTLLLAAMGARMDPATKREGNALLRRAGFDGNGRFRRVGEALNVAFSTLAKVGIEADEVLSAHFFKGESGTKAIDLAYSNKEDPFSPEPISNSVLHFSWSTLDNGTLEVVAYLS